MTTSRRQPGTANDPTTTAIGADEVLGTHKWRARASGVLLRRYRYPRAARSPALERIPYSCGRSARHHLDTRRARSDARRLGRRRTEGEPSPSVQQCRCRSHRQRLSCWRRGRRAVLRLADRSARTQEAVFHHARGVPFCDRGHRPFVESRELRAVPPSHRRGHRRRICRDQLDHPGARSRPSSRMDRSRHQRQLLDRRGHGRTGRRPAARSGPDRSGIRLAVGVSARRDLGVGDLLHADVAAREVPAG